MRQARDHALVLLTAQLINHRVLVTDDLREIEFPGVESQPRKPTLTQVPPSGRPWFDQGGLRAVIVGANGGGERGGAAPDDDKVDVARHVSALISFSRTEPSL